MNWNKWVRQIHRWVAILFTMAVAFIFGALGLGRAPAEWVYFLPLLPLAILTPTGLYLFALPYVSRRRSAGRASDGE